ncbi:MAG: hypothetical protein ACE5EI_10495 [Thermodesulfobacteriota bacterium]
MSEQDIDRIAEQLADKLESRCGVCTLSTEEQEEIKSILRTKKGSVKVFLWLIGALVVWILKDVYLWTIGHLTFR